MRRVRDQPACNACSVAWAMLTKERNGVTTTSDEWRNYANYVNARSCDTVHMKILKRGCPFSVFFRETTLHFIQRSAKNSTSDLFLSDSQILYCI